MSWSIDYSDWRIFKRFEDLNAAYVIGLREAPAAIYAETSYHLEEFLKGILPALLQMCIVQAASTAVGAGIGAGLGAFVFGAGAIPGAAIGAELGFDLGLAILGWLGLAFLAIAIGHSLGDLVVLIKAAVVQAWGAADKGDARGQNVRQAGQTLARAIAILVRLILTGIVAWLTKKGIDKAPELIAELKASKLGVGFAEWVEKNLGKLTSDPKLKPHRGEGSTTKPLAESEAQSPSQLAKRPVEEAPPPPPKRQAKPKKQRKPRQPQQYEKKVVNEDGSTTYTLKTKEGELVDVTYKDGYPDFSPHKYDGPLGKNEVQIDMTGKNSTDFPAANKEAGFGDQAYSHPDDYTWHHHQDGTTMQLIRTDVHAAAPHTGGASAARLAGSE